MKRLGHLRAPVYTDLRLTIPAREALEALPDNVCLATWTPSGPRYAVTLVRPPVGLVVVRFVNGTSDTGLRLDSEPEYPCECPAAWYEHGSWVPCPEAGCGFALMWCEAGFVPGWRVCLGGHASQLSGDGRRAERMVSHDAAMLRATRPVGAR